MTSAVQSHSNETLFRTFFENISDCMFHVQVEADGRFTYADVNAAGLEAAGLAIEEMRRREPVDVLGPVKGQEMTEALQNVVRTGKPHHYEPSWEMETGLIVYDAVYMPLRDETGRVKGILGSARNITERKRTEAALHQARKVEVIGQLASGIAHDFNNLISAFQACLRLLDGEANADRRQEILREAHDALDRGKALTGWLTGFIRQAPVKLETIDLNAAIGRLQGMLYQCLPREVALRIDLSPGPLEARADKNEIGLAILNLALNARDAMPDGGSLRLSTRREDISDDEVGEIKPGSYAVIDVADTGVGMSPELVDRVVEPFFTTKPVGQGTGLGLSMVAGILQRAGGGLQIASELGHGTCISLYFEEASGQAAA